jgi:hypothetical protein
VAIEKVPVSAAVLASRSPVFRKMFFNGMLESEKDQRVTVKLGSQGKHCSEICNRCIIVKALKYASKVKMVCFIRMWLQA